MKTINITSHKIDQVSLTLKMKSIPCQQMVLLIDLQQYLQFLFIHDNSANMYKYIPKWLSDFIGAISKYKNFFGI